MLIINTAIGFTTELRARRAMDALLQFDVVRAAVLRDGRLVSIDAADLVTGDVVQLNAGQQVPADARLSEGTDLRTIEASLTGESLPIEKQSASTLDAATPVADRTNMVFKGTSVAAGARALPRPAAEGAGPRAARSLVVDRRAVRGPHPGDCGSTAQTAASGADVM